MHSVEPTMQEIEFCIASKSISTLHVLWLAFHKMMHLSLLWQIYVAASIVAIAIVLCERNVMHDCSQNLEDLERTPDEIGLSECVTSRALCRLPVHWSTVMGATVLIRSYS